MSEPDDLLGSLGKLRPTEKLAQLLTIYYVTKVAFTTVRNFYINRRAELSYTISVPDSDDNYEKLHSWLLDQIPNKKRRSILVKSTNETLASGDSSQSTYEQELTNTLNLAYDGNKEQTIYLNEHKIKMWVWRENSSINLNGDSFLLPGESKICFLAQTPEGKDEVLKLLTELMASEKVLPRFRLARSWGDFNTYDMRLRSLETIILKEGQKEEIVEDLEWFLKSENEYMRLGIPWHRGYMFYGPPGTGKTSLAKALADHFGMDIYYIALSDLQNDVKIVDLMANIKPRSILLFEDIDVVHGAKVRDDDHKGISLSGILNAIDGISTPHGLIMIMTSNDISQLDAAMMRPGRIDKMVELNYLNDDQINRMAEFVLGERIDLPFIKREISPAEAMEALVKRNKDEDPRTKLIELLLKD